MTYETLKVEDMKPRHIPMLSQIMFFPVQLSFAVIHFLLVFVAQDMEPTVSMFVVSGFFGVVPLVPVVFFWMIGKLVEWLGLCSTSTFWTWVATPFYTLYVVNILLLDQTHKVVKNSGVYKPSRALESVTATFFWAFTRYFKGYITCVPWAKGARLPTDSTTYIFGAHPHGIHCTALVELGNPYGDFAEMFPNVSGVKLTGLAATIIFKIPVVREMFLYMGYIDASRSVASEALAAGQSIYLCIGGEEESLLTTPGKDIYVLKERKGFIRLALSYGASLVPVLGIGTNEAYTTYNVLYPARKWIQKRFGIALPIFHGRWFTPLPHKVPIKIVIGEPIPTPKSAVVGEKPSEELVNEFHARYIEAVRKLHGKHAGKDTELLIQ